ncbi:hypothetical protein [Pedobacter alpinus]|uniref:DUF4199 domain-containing protein n=1 Tax=Pedobacter alpinus TaxID=1590643 RepID=A0ABW5TSG4_9SPHI
MKTLLFMLMAFSFLDAFNQTTISTDTIEVKKGFGTVFKQNGKPLTPKQLLNITEANPEAYQQMQIAKRNYAPATIFGSIGGFLVGYPLGSAIGGGKPNWTLAGIGAGLIGLSIPFSSAYTKHTKNAVETYNNGLQKTGFKPKVNFNIGIAGNGVGLKMVF